MATRGVILTCAVVAVEVILSYAVLTRGAIQVKPIYYNIYPVTTWGNSNIVHNDYRRTILNLANKQFTLVLKGLELLGHTIEIIIIACLKKDSYYWSHRVMEDSRRGGQSQEGNLEHQGYLACTSFDLVYPSLY